MYVSSTQLQHLVYGTEHLLSYAILIHSLISSPFLQDKALEHADHGLKRATKFSYSTKKGTQWLLDK